MVTHTKPALLRSAAYFPSFPPMNMTVLLNTIANIMIGTDRKISSNKSFDNQ